MHGEFAGDHPVGPGLAGWHQLLTQPGDASLDVGGRAWPFVGFGSGQDHIGVGQHLAGRGGHGDNEACALERPASQATIRKVRQRVGTEEHQCTHRSTLGMIASRGGQDLGRPPTPLRGYGPPRSFEPVPTSIE